LSNNITGEYHQNEPTTKILHSSSSIFFKQQQQKKKKKKAKKNNYRLSKIQLYDKKE
jgi:hypothetical protein